MNTYLLFQGDFYYPDGGYGDFIAKYSSHEQALKSLDDSKDWYQIVNKNEIVESGVILRSDHVLRLKSLNEVLVINERVISGHGNTVLIAWYEKLGQQFAILKELPYE